MAQFDTHATFQTLQAHGLSSDQAEGVTAVLVAAFATTGEAHATKADLATLRYDLTSLLETRFAAIDTQFAAVRSDLRSLSGHVRWLMAGLGVSILLALVANAFALVALLR